MRDPRTKPELWRKDVTMREPATKLDNWKAVGGRGNAETANPEIMQNSDEPKMRRASKILREAADLHEERNKVYGDNYKQLGYVVEALFPNGVYLQTKDDHNRFHLFILQIVKLTRYANNWSKGGHQDSVRDLIVYSAMLEEVDAEISEGLDEGAMGRTTDQEHNSSV
jgi:hypothetical protein